MQRLKRTAANLTLGKDGIFTYKRLLSLNREKLSDMLRTFPVPLLRAGIHVFGKTSDYFVYANVNALKFMGRLATQNDLGKQRTGSKGYLQGAFNGHRGVFAHF